MNLRAGFPFDLIKNGLPFDYPRLEKNLNTDVVVIGGGISGALVAHYLVKENISCIVADARTIGLGSTCASTSLLQYEIDTPISRLSQMIGTENAKAAYRLCGDCIYYLQDIAKEIGFRDFKVKGSLYYAAYKKDAEFLESEFEKRKAAGFNVRLLKSSEIKQDFGFTASAAILSELAATTNAYMFTHYLHQHNIRKGLQVFDRTEITQIRHDKTRVSLNTVNGFNIRAKKLVFATGYEAAAKLPRRMVRMHSTYATISEALTKPPPYWKDDVVIWNTANPYLYMRSTPDHRIAIGGRDVPFTSPAFRDKLIRKKSSQLRDDFRKLFPHVSFVPEFSWTGNFVTTRDGLPYIGEFRDLPNAYFALGFGGNGITFSDLAGRMIANFIKGKRNEYPALFSFTRP
jgi:glycine/D-amino acid oxidase-like deaminating enzyme